MMKLSEKPFFLNENQISWVRETLSSMSVEDKLRQLFCLVTYSEDEEFCRMIGEEVRPGGIMSRTVALSSCLSTVEKMQRYSKIPLLVAANLESGGNGIVSEGTFFSKPMGIAATAQMENARRLGEICGVEGSAAGANWSFAPIGDIDWDWRNPITNTRTFGSDPKTVEKCCLAYLEEVQKYGLAACLKHFPGDGRDERDQHVAPSVNDLPLSEWERTYGKIYRTGIEAGVKTIMIGHILFPDYLRQVSPDTPESDYLPASVSKEVVTGLLRGRLGFEGLIITDSTVMTGLTAFLPRKDLVPMAIAAGCDMFLFTKNLEEDFAFMKDGFERGVFTEKRLDEAVTKILALKASLHLPEKKENGTLVPKLADSEKIVGNEIFKTWSKNCASQAITLVKEEAGVLPITTERYSKILLFALENSKNEASFFGWTSKSANEVADRLKSLGFSVDVFEAKPGFEGMLTPVKDTEQYDLILYIASLATRSNQTVVRIEWANPMGANTPVFCHTVPTVFISLENPYHLVDVPQIRTYINCYSSSSAILDALIRKLMGKEKFTGVSPVDPFCGKWETKLPYLGKQSTIRGILFDLDGVLVFTDRFHSAAWKKIAEEYHLSFDDEFGKKLRGVGRKDCVELLAQNSGRNLSAKEKEVIADKKNEYYLEALSELSPSAISDNLRSLLARLRKKGYRLAVASSSQNTKRILELIGLQNCFDTVVDGTMIKKSKPDPEVFLLAANRLHLLPSACLVLEDAEAGLLAAERAGMKSFGVGNGYPLSSVEDLESLLS